MPRYIDAERFSERFDMMCDAGGVLAPVTKAVREMVKKLIKAEPTTDAEPVKDWISIGDRLPEPETWVMVYIEYPSPVLEMETGIQEMSNIKKMFYDGKSFYCDFGEIKHWQPLPEPPKKKKSAAG